MALVTGYAALGRPAEARLTDLSVYLGAVSSTSLYDFSRGAAPFTYPPFAALAFRPLALLPVSAVQVAWTLATAGAAVLLARLAAPTSAKALAGAAAPTFAKAPVVALVLMLSAPVSSDFRYGQVSLFLAVLVLADVLGPFRRAGRRWQVGPAQGVLIGVAAAIKLTPLIFIPMLWAGGRRRAAGVAVATFAACGAAAWVVLPADSLRYWTAEIRDVERLGYISSVGNQSLNGALLRAGLSPAVRSVAVLLLGGLIVLLALRRARALARAGNWLAATVVVGAASIVFSPVSWTHHQVWLVLAVLLPVHRAWRWTAVAVMVLPVTALGPPVLSNARLLLAIAVAAVIPLAQGGPRRSGPIGAADLGTSRNGRGPATGAGAAPTAHRSS